MLSQPMPLWMPPEDYNYYFFQLNSTFRDSQRYSDEMEAPIGESDVDTADDTHGKYPSQCRAPVEFEPRLAVPPFPEPLAEGGDGEFGRHVTHCDRQWVVEFLRDKFEK